MSKNWERLMSKMIMYVVEPFIAFWHYNLSSFLLFWQPPHGDDLASICYTSGTTDAPKVMLNRFWLSIDHFASLLQGCHVVTRKYCGQFQCNFASFGRVQTQCEWHVDFVFTFGAHVWASLRGTVLLVIHLNNFPITLTISFILVGCFSSWWQSWLL